MIDRRPVPLRLLLALALAPLLAFAQTGTRDVYYPGAAWQHRTPAEAGISAPLLKDAIDFAIAGETRAPRDLNQSLPDLRPRAVRLCHRPDQGPRRRPASSCTRAMSLPNKDGCAWTWRTA
jgi:hypothetical protein